MSQYSVLGDVVAISGSLIAAATAIGLAWMRRAKWMPPVETVPGATVRISALICAVLVAILYVRRNDIGSANLSYMAGGFLVATLGGLVASIYVNTAYSFIKRPPGRKPSPAIETRILGGFVITPEARRIAKEHNDAGQQWLFENSNYNPDLVWTKGSQAALQVVSTLGFIVLQAFGSLSLASIALVVSLSVV